MSLLVNVNNLMCAFRDFNTVLDLTIIDFEELKITYHNIKTCLNFKDSLTQNNTCKRLRITCIDGYNDDDDFYQFVNDLNEFLGFFTAVTKIIMPQYSRTYFYKLVNILCCKDYENIKGIVNFSQIKHLSKGNKEQKIISYNFMRRDDGHHSIEFDRTNVNMLFYDDKGVRKIKVKLLKFVTSLNNATQIGDYLLFTEYPKFFTISTSDAVEEKEFQDAELRSLFWDKINKSSNRDADSFLFGIEWKSKVVQWRSGSVRHFFSNSRDLYCFRYYYDVKHFIKEIKQIPENCIVEYLIESNAEIFIDKLRRNFEKIVGSDPNWEGKHKFQTIDFRSYSIFKQEKHFKQIEYFCKNNPRLRDLELTLDNNEFVLRILQSLEKNYMIKTIRLSCLETVNKEIIEYVRQFKSQRVGLDISFNSHLKEFKALNRKVSESYYPDEFCYD